MLLSELGLDGIKAFEACMQALIGRPGYYTTYRDSAGVLTIGWGHTNAAGPPHIGPGVVWTQTNCDDALIADLRKVGLVVYDALGDAKFEWSTLTQSQFDALVSFEYNTGDLHRSSIPQKMAAGQMDEAIATLLLYDHDREGHILRGLQRRRMYEAALMRGNLMGAAQLADLHLQSDPQEQVQTAVAIATPPTFILPATVPPSDGAQSRPATDQIENRTSDGATPSGTTLKEPAPEVAPTPQQQPAPPE